MPVDKLGRNGDRTTKVYIGINIENLANSFLRRDEGNTAIGAIDMNSNIIKNVTDPLSNQDVATKNYVDTNAFITAGGVVSGDIKLNVCSDLVMSLGCNDLSAGKKFTLLLGTDTTYSVSNSGLPVPIKIKTDVGFAILLMFIYKIYRKNRCKSIQCPCKLIPTNSGSSVCLPIILFHRDRGNCCTQ